MKQTNGAVALTVVRKDIIGLNVLNHLRILWNGQRSERIKKKTVIKQGWMSQGKGSLAPQTGMAKVNMANAKNY